MPDISSTNSPTENAAADEAEVRWVSENLDAEFHSLTCSYVMKGRVQRVGIAI